MADESLTYCDSEEETFFGKVTEKELLKSALLGQNYFSPAVTFSTPRPNTTNVTNRIRNILPDVLKGSPGESSMVKHAEASGTLDIADDNKQSKHEPHVKSMEEDDNIEISKLESNTVVPELESRTTTNIIEPGNGSVLFDLDLKSKEFIDKCQIGKPENNRSLSDHESETKTTPETIVHGNINPASIEALIQASLLLENAEYIYPVSQENKISNNMNLNPLSNYSDLSDFDCSSLSGISDSILNKSHGSSLPTPPTRPVVHNSPLTKIMHEDISCDGEQLLNAVNDTLPKSVAEADGLHLSINDADFKQRGFVSNCETSLSISQPSLYKSCLNESDASSSYNTAYNTNSKNLTDSSQLSSPFRNYRKTNLEDNDENELETSFEMIAQKRQNSFTASPIKKSGDATEQVQSKTTSKLPVYQSYASLIKPPKLYVNLETLKANNSKWAKTLQKLEDGKVDSNWRKQESSKTVNSSKQNLSPPCSGAKAIPRPQSKPSHIERKTPNSKFDNRILNKAKTPSENKTLARNLTSHLSRSVKSDSKIPKILTPVIKGNMSSEKKGETKLPLSLQQKDRYKNVISPIHAYITGIPVVLQRKAHNFNIPSCEKTHIVGSANKNTESQIPLKKHTPSNLSKAIQKLDFGNVEGQENVDPNNPCDTLLSTPYIAPSKNPRDTLPPRILQASSAVFLKESEQPRKHLPKIGETMQKLLDTPRPKVIVHHGRVRESPMAKGVLIPSTTESPSGQHVTHCDNRISVRVVKSAEKTNILK